MSNANANALPDDLQLLTARQVADLLGLHVRSVWRMASAHELPIPIRFGNRITRWRRADLEEFITKRTGGQNAE